MDISTILALIALVLVVIDMAMHRSVTLLHVAVLLLALAACVGLVI
jgi:hypothetical protein